jgi:hypothetical protein
MSQTENHRWIPLGVVFESDPTTLVGINLWDHAWESMGQQVLLYHPLYPLRPENLSVYRITTNDATIEFAASEVSANAWAFFITAEQQRKCSAWRISKDRSACQGANDEVQRP